MTAHINEGKQMRHFSLATKTKLTQQIEIKVLKHKKKNRWATLVTEGLATKLEVGIRTPNFYPSELPWSLAVGSSNPSCGPPFAQTLWGQQETLVVTFRPIGRVTKPHQKKKKRENNENFTLPIKHWLAKQQIKGAKSNTLSLAINQKWLIKTDNHNKD
jgi:hypothetical protein